MFGLGRKQREAVEERAASAPPLAPLAPEAEPAPQHLALLQRWMSLAEIQQRVIQSLAAEVTRTSGFVEAEAGALSGRFQRLAEGAQEQTERVDSLTKLAAGVEVEGKSVPILEIAGLLESTLSDVVEKILLLSKDSMTMVYALETIHSNIQSVGECMQGLEKINRTANMLALNARIEAERAGASGAAFRIVANEVRELSRETQGLCITMGTELRSVIDGIEAGRVTLQRVATIDMSDNIMAKGRLELLLAGLVTRGGDLETIVADAVRESGVMSADVGGMITGIQFQDRTKQRLEHVVDALHVIDRAIGEIRRDTAAETPELVRMSASDTEWVKKLLAGFTMSEMRERFVAELLDGQPIEASDAGPSNSTVSSSGSVELF